MRETMRVRELVWLICGLACDHMVAAALLVVRGPRAARNHLRDRVYGWPAEKEIR